MATSVREVESHASESARLSGRAVGAAERGRERVAQTVAGMEAIRSETESARQVMTALGVRASEIGRILEVIDDVADRTSLLALNAAIISAQAGEHGRAFAVVADEIRSLAERVRESTREIEARVRAVQSAATDAAAAIERGAQRVQQGVALSVEAGDSLDEITQVARENGERMEGIVSAIREQAKAAAHVAELMDQLQAGVERIRRASQEQDRGNELILGEVVDMRGASERVSATAREQESGTARIRDAYEGVRGAVERIAAALQEQSQACSRSAELLVEMNQRTFASEASVGGMGEATQALAAEAESLRAAVGRFQL
jgi:methyl-accepting chemotaxis protein